MLLNANIIKEIAKRNKISLPAIAVSVFAEKSNEFLDFVDNPALKTKLQFDYNKLANLAKSFISHLGIYF